MHIPVDLQETLKRRECVLFVGAGLSEGLPNWRELMKPLADELDVCTEEDPRIIAEYYENEFGRLNLEEKIIMQLQKDVPLTNTHKLLAELPFRAIVTTNYDHFLERTLSKRNFVKIIDGKEAPLAEADQFPLIKMHGDLDDPSTMVITKTDYDEYAEKHRTLVTYLLGFLISYNFLFVGFGLKDPNFDNIFVQIKSLFEGSRRKSYAILRNPSEHEVKRLRRIGIEVIPIKKYRDVQEIFGEIAGICSEKTRRKSELTPLELEGIRKAFCEVVERQNKWLDPRGIFQYDRMLAMKEVELAEVYVVPRLMKRELLRKRKNKERERNKSEELEEYSFETRVESTLREVLFDSRNNQMVILGDPGAGKTCLLQYIALRASTNTTESLGIDGSLLPVFISLREYGKFGSNVMFKEFVFDYIRNQICSVPKRILETFLEENSFFFLLDGLDEVMDESQRIEVSRQVERFIAQYPSTRIILTSRFAGYKPAALVGAIPHFTLAEFNDNEVRKFLTKWFAFLEKTDGKGFRRTDAEHMVHVLVDVILRNNKILRLIRNPLLLAILVLIYKEGREIPEKRAEFYECAVNTIIGTWEGWKNLQTNRKIPRKETILAILEKVGFKMHSKKKENIVKTDELKTWLKEAMEEEAGFSSREEINDFIWMLNQRGGLLVEKGPESYGFVHMTFQEYFAARYIAVGRGVGSAEDLVRRHLYSNRWQEVIFLAVGIASPEEAGIILDSVLEAENPFEDHIHSNLMLAGLMLANSMKRGDWREDYITEKLVFFSFNGKVDLLRIDAIRTLAKIERLFEPKNTRVSGFLHDRHPHIRLEALIHFTNIRARDLHIQNEVIHRLKDKHPFVRKQAVIYFATIEATDPEIQSRIRDLLKDKHPFVRKQAAIYFTTIEATDPEIQSRIRDLLDNKSRHIRKQAATHPTTIEATDPEIQSRISDTLGKEDRCVHRKKFKEFSSSGVRDPRKRNNMIEMLSDKNPTSMRRKALEYFSNARIKDSEVQSKILDLLNIGSRTSIRRKAIEYFTAIEARDPGIQSRILNMLNYRNTHVREEALRYFISTEAKNHEIRNKIFELLEDEARSCFSGRTIQGIALEYLLKYAKTESFERAPILFKSGNKYEKRGAYRLMKGLLQTQRMSV